MKTVPAAAALAACALGPLLLAGCGLQAPGIARRSLWTGQPPPADRPDVHLVVAWKPPPAVAAARVPWARERLAAELAGQLEARGLACVRSRQLVAGPADLRGFLPFWRPGLPVVWVSVAASVDLSSAAPSASLELRARYQPRLFDTSEEWARGQASVRAGRGFAAADPGQAAAWFRASQPGLFREAVSGLLPRLGRLAPSDGVVRFRRGEGGAMSRGFASAEKGDWASAAAAWEEAAAAQPGREAPLSALSVAREMLGDWGRAADAERRRLELEPAGLLARRFTAPWPRFR